MPKLKDLTGQHFGRLTVIERAENGKDRKPRWVCECTCGAKVVIGGYALKSGKTQSCGCLRKEKSSERSLKNLVGQRFGRLTVIERAENLKSGKVRWKCRCECGVEKIVSSQDLKRGHVQSCGCLKKEILTKHGMTGTVIYGTWHAIRDRCNNPNLSSYENYGGRGIKVCERWLDFQNFYDDISKLEHFGEEGYTLDRIDNNGNYEPGNVRWANSKTQARNTRRNIIVEYEGEKMCLMDVAERSGIQYNVLWKRFHCGEDLIKPVEKIIPKSDLILVENNQALTTSLIVAEYFEMRHDNVLRAIENELTNLRESSASTRDLKNEGSKIDAAFIKGEYEVEGQTRKYPMYYLNRDGFFQVALGFTGKKASKLRWNFIQEFNRMEKALLKTVIKTF